MRITIIAHPNSKKTRVKKDLLGRLHIYVSEPPLEGRANQAIAILLAKHLGVRKSAVVLLKGQKFKYKVFEIAKD